MPNPSDTDQAIADINRFLQQQQAANAARRARDAALIARYNEGKGVPRSATEAVLRSAGTGFVDAALNVPLNIAGYLPFIGPRMRQAAAEIRQANERSAQKISAFPTQNPLTSAVIQAPQTISSIAQDVYSPAAKIRLGARLAAQTPKIAAFVEKYGPEAVTTLYHAVRGSSDGRAASGAFVSGSGHLVGEQIVEPTAVKMLEKLLPSFGKKLEAGFALGNVGGALYENMASEVLGLSEAENR